MASIGLEASDQLEVMRLHVDAALEALVDDEIQNGAGQVAELCASMLLAGGKRLRPLLILLAHEIAGGEDVEEVMPLALAFEMIHTATLVHDDINDEASLRRGVETIHTRAGLAKAVIAGDWLFVQGFGLGGRYRKESGEDLEIGEEESGDSCVLDLRSLESDAKVWYAQTIRRIEERTGLNINSEVIPVYSSVAFTLGGAPIDENGRVTFFGN